MKPEECVVFEDSRSGMLAAIAAKMPLVCVQSHPSIDSSLCKHKISDFRKITLKELLNFPDDHSSS
jgi:beta-phosphoglucomutase-like phosphatase (HAD superfamily)